MVKIFSLFILIYIHLNRDICPCTRFSFLIPPTTIMCSLVNPTEFASRLNGDENLNYVTIFNPTNPRLGAENQAFLKSQSYKDCDMKEKNEWKQAVVAELEKKGLTIVGVPATASASATTPTDSAKNPIPALAFAFVNSLNIDGVNGTKTNHLNLTNPNFRMQTDASKKLLEDVKKLEAAEKKSFLLMVSSILCKKGITVNLWNGEDFNPKHNSAAHAAAPAAERPSPKHSPLPSGSTKGKGKKPAVDLATLIAKLMEAGLNPVDAAKGAQAVLDAIN